MGAAYGPGRDWSGEAKAGLLTCGHDFGEGLGVEGAEDSGEDCAV